MGSARLRLNLGEVWSAARHFVFPILGGAVIDVVDAWRGAGELDFVVAKTIFGASCLAGGGRLIQQLLSDNTKAKT